MKQLLLIVLLPTAKQKLEKRGWHEGLDRYLQVLGNTRNIRLYHLPDKNNKQDKQNKQEFVIALPFDRGKVLLLKKDDSNGSGQDYFICIGCQKFNAPPEAAVYYHELPGNVEIRRVVDSGEISSYLLYAVDCDEINRKVKTKKPWEPHKGAAPEGKKWKAYLDLYENMLKKNRFGFPANKLKVNGKNAEISFNFSGIPDIDESEVNKKIKNARGELVHFSLTPDAVESWEKDYKKAKLGKLRATKGNNITIELDEGFNSALKEQIGQRKFYGRDSAAEHEHNVSDTTEEQDTSSTALPFEYVKLNGQRETDFYYDKDRENRAFSCRAKRGDSVWQIDPDSIEPLRIMVFADFVGDFYQIGVMKHGVKDIRKLPIWEILSGERVAKLPEEENITNIKWEADCRLNDQQKEAVEKALGIPELCLIWGPPGTGKTEVIAEIARQEAQRGRKVLISSQANLAVDNALARLHDKDGVWTFRQTKYEHKLEKEDEMKVPTWETADRFFAERLRRRISSGNANSEFSDLRRNLAKRLKQHIEQPVVAERRKRDMQMAKLYRKKINVVGATLIETGKWDHKEKKKKLLVVTGIDEFDTVIIDEVSKALPPELFLPILVGKRVVLVGDHKQLPPTFKMQNGDDLALEKWAEMAEVPKEEVDTDTTIFEQLWKKHDEDAAGVRTMLTKQYRMHRKIQKLIEQFYDDSEGRLECGLSDEEQRKMTIAGEGDFAGQHAVWADTGSSAKEETRIGTSYANDDEMRIVGEILNDLPNDRDMSVGVITFYGAQLRKLHERYEQRYARKFPEGKLIFGTVDRFQGRECDVIICSLVRKNKRGGIGFAEKVNRINVAFSRARKLLCIVGNSGHFCYESRNDPAKLIYKKIYDKCNQIFI